MRRLEIGIHRALVRTLLRRAYGARLAPAQRRRRIEGYARAALLPRGTRLRRTRVDGVEARWVCARGIPEDAGAALLYLHGGGFVTGSPRTHAGLASRLSAAAGLPVLIPDYRLAPEHPHPAARDDCAAVYAALAAPEPAGRALVLGGDSAGGFLALELLLGLARRAQPLPRAAFLISPACDLLELDGESYATRRTRDPWFSREILAECFGHYLPAADRRADVCRPLASDLAGLPPMRIDVGDDEVLLSDSLRLAERARASGVDTTLRIWPRMWHDFPLFAGTLPDGRRAIEAIGRFLRAALAPPPAR